jgi:excisionase family DNA binding protein
MNENILTIREVADLLKINEKTAYKLVADAKIPGFKVGGSWRFDQAAISKWIERGSMADAVPSVASGAKTEVESSNGERLAAAYYAPQQATFFAHRITLEGTGEDALAQSLSTARVDMNPHQVDAALFALASPLSKGVLLADEVGLGKTIEASLVIAQRWAERRRHILLIVPASLRKQWSQELFDKFSLPSVIVESKTYKEARKAGVARP